MEDHSRYQLREGGARALDRNSRDLLLVRVVTDKYGMENIVVSAHVEGVRETRRWDTPSVGLTEPLLNAVLTWLETLATGAIVSQFGGVQQAL